MSLPYIIMAVSFFLSAVCASVTLLHMLQLASYQTAGYNRWLKQSGDTVVRNYLPVCVVALMGLIQWEYMPYIAAALFVVLGILCRPRVGAKKPFKLTARALRILITLIILLALIILAFTFLYGRFRYALLAGAYLGLIYLVPLAGIICLPIEKAISARFIRDAKRILSSHPNLTVIGVTGSYGKTSVKSFITGLMSVRYNVLMTPESYNTPMGVVRTIRERLEPSHNYFICEMGARHKGDIKEICDIVNPGHGAVTSIGPQHLETFKTVNNIISTKFELIGSLPAGGMSFLAWDDENIRTHGADTKNAVRYGTTPGLDYSAGEISVGPEGSSFTVTVRGGESRRFNTKLLGTHNVRNITCAIAVAHSFGIPLSELVPAVRALCPVPHRLELIQRGNGITLIDDAYNSNPAGVRAALETLRMFDGVRVMITPGMVELGESQDKENREFGVLAREVCDYAALVGEKQTASIAEGFADTERVRVFTTFGEALEWVLSIDREGREMYVLLENDLPDNY